MSLFYSKEECLLYIAVTAVPLDSWQQCQQCRSTSGSSDSSAARLMTAVTVVSLDSWQQWHQLLADSSVGCAARLQRAVLLGSRQQCSAAGQQTSVQCRWAADSSVAGQQTTVTAVPLGSRQPCQQWRVAAAVVYINNFTVGTALCSWNYLILVLHCCSCTEPLELRCCWNRTDQ